jgi:hypothetical protein
MIRLWTKLGTVPIAVHRQVDRNRNRPQYGPD